MHNLHITFEVNETLKQFPTCDHPLLVTALVSMLFRVNHLGVEKDSRSTDLGGNLDLINFYFLSLLKSKET